MRLEAAHVNPVAVPTQLRARIQIILLRILEKSLMKNLFFTCWKLSSDIKLMRPIFQSKRSSELSSGVKLCAKCPQAWSGNGIVTFTPCACWTKSFPTTSFSERSSALAANHSRPGHLKTATTYQLWAKLKFKARCPKSSKMWPPNSRRRESGRDYSRQSSWVKSRREAMAMKSR